MDYGEVLTRAWQIVWKYKVLWLFGILAGCGQAGGNSFGSGSNSGFRQNGNFNLPGSQGQYLNQVQRFFENMPVWVWIVLAAVLLVLFVIVVILNTIGRIGLVQGAVQADEGAASLSFGPLFNTSFRYFWRVFLLNLVVGLAFVVVFAILAAVIIAGVIAGVATLGVALLCLVPLACILVPALILLTWLVNLVVEQSVIAIVAEDQGITAGLRRGWEVVTHHIGPFIVMALILFVGGAVIGLIAAIPMALIVIPPVLGALSGARNATLIGFGIAAVLFILYLPVLLVITGVLRAYITTSWTLTFRRLTRPPEILPVEVPPPAPVAV
ncbi:MAG TPA: hypothetical protein VF813_04505 [Anaerolineaceae bacterium]